jgi:hypothetical protein
MTESVGINENLNDFGNTVPLKAFPVVSFDTVGRQNKISHQSFIFVIA